MHGPIASSGDRSSSRGRCHSKSSTLFGSDSSVPVRRFCRSSAACRRTTPPGVVVVVAVVGAATGAFCDGSLVDAGWLIAKEGGKRTGSRHDV